MNRLPKIFFLCVISLNALDAQSGAKPVAGVGSTIITRAELDGMVATEALDSIQTGQTRISAVRQWQASALIARLGREQRIYEEIGTRIAGYSAWRNHLLGAVAKRQVQKVSNGDRSLIEEIYNYRNTSILSRYLVAIDSLSAVDLRKRWLAGGRFETLALNTFTLDGLLSSPGEPGWRYPKDLDTIYAQIAYSQAEGEISQPALINNKYYLIQTLRTHFQPDHGHFERVKHMQNIASKLPDGAGVSLADAEASLDEWVADLPIKWKRWGSRKVLKSGVLESQQRSAATDAPIQEILARILFTLDDRDYNVDWVLERLELLPPKAQFNIESGSDLRQLITGVLKWNRMLESVAAMPEADAIILEAENLRQTAIEKTVRQTLQERYLRSYKIPEEILAAYLTSHQDSYREATLVDVSEIIIDDSLFANAMADSIKGGAAFSDLAADYTLRKWSRITGGHLGWIPDHLYSPHADSLKFVGAGALVGPLSIDEYYVLLEVRDYAEAPELRVGGLRERLRFNWLAEHKDSLVTDWIWAMDRSDGLSWLDTNLVLGIEVPEVAADTTTLIFDAGLSGADSLAIPDSTLVIPQPR
jgi:parvulin-like peptidyl-prolyl isomerase